MPSLKLQLVELFVLAIPVACVAWTVTHEEVFREPREYCQRRSHDCIRWYQRKFFYLFTCEYCFSHYVAALFLVITRFKPLMQRSHDRPDPRRRLLDDAATRDQSPRRATA